MFFQDNIVTESEKIDYIYRKTKSQARAKTLGLILKLAIIWFIFFLYYTNLRGMNFDQIMDKYIIPEISKMVSKTVNKTMESSIPAWTWITPEMQKLIEQQLKSR